MVQPTHSSQQAQVAVAAVVARYYRTKAVSNTIEILINNYRLAHQKTFISTKNDNLDNLLRENVDFSRFRQIQTGEKTIEF